MDNDNMPKLGLVGELGHSEDILAMLDKCDSESEVEDDSQEKFESSDIDDILDDYTPVADFDDSRATGSRPFVDEEPEHLTQRGANVNYVRIQECVQLPSHKDKHLLKSDVNRNLGRPKDLIREQFTTTECGIF
ncbi:unnamed protein product [Orchesella dallaii]|uniref:Uncharacterized protein n=1 Tax=Orchesella dallaii TaxID=48710 RepID=A0ABP1RDW7_9HEXA